MAGNASSKKDIEAASAHMIRMITDTNQPDVIVFSVLRNILKQWATIKNNQEITSHNVVACSCHRTYSASASECVGPAINTEISKIIQTVNNSSRKIPEDLKILIL